MPFADRGESSAKFAAFNAAQMAKRAAEVDAEDRLFEAKERERQKAEAKRAAQAKKNLERRERLLAMGISEEDMRGIGVSATLAGTSNPWHCSAVTNFDKRTSRLDSTGMFLASLTNCVKTSLAVWSVRADCS